MAISYSDIGASIVTQTAVAIGDVLPGRGPDVPSASLVSSLAHDGVDDQCRSGRLPDILADDILVFPDRDDVRERAEFILAGIVEPSCGIGGKVDSVGVVIIVYGVIAGIFENGG